MNYWYLVINTEYFFDGHGVAEAGGITKAVEYTDKYNHLDLSKTFNDSLLEYSIEDEEGEIGAEDGYHCIRAEISIRKITSIEAEEYMKIIEGYNSL